MLNDSQKLKEIIRLGSELNTIQDLDILLDKILHEAKACVNADAATIYIRDGKDLIFSHAQNDSLAKKLPPGKKLMYTTFRLKISRRSIAGYVAHTGEILNIPDVYKISKKAPYHFNSSYDKETGYKTTSVLTVPIKDNRNELLGVMQIINAFCPKSRVKAFDSDDELYILHFANTVSMILQRAQMTRALILRMISMAELRDPKETGAHVNRVASYSVEIYEEWARRKGIEKREIDINRDILRMAAMLHDVGKVAISDLILKKPAKFTDEEYEIMKTHTFQGARLFKFKQSEFDEISAIVALTHHENWDGTGYPGNIDVETGKAVKNNPHGKAKPLKGKKIPIFGRIVAIADVYDALSSKRVYKKAWDENSVLDEMKKMSGIKFDPELIDIFFDCIDFIRAISKRYPDKE